MKKPRPRWIDRGFPTKGVIAGTITRKPYSTTRGGGRQAVLPMPLPPSRGGPFCVCRGAKITRRE
jgi:hypothetical protein